MACCDDIKLDIIACRLTLTLKDGVWSECISGYSIDESCKEIELKLCNGGAKKIDFQKIVNFSTWESLKVYITTTLARCCSSDSNLELDFVSIETIYRCHKVTCQKVAIEKCKDRNGGVLYRLESDGTTVILSDYEVCDKPDLVQDVREFIVDIQEGDNEQFLIVPDKYHNIMIDNQSQCPVIVQVDIMDKTGDETVRNIKLKPYQNKTFDWDTDVIDKITVGQCEETNTLTGITDVDNLDFVPAIGNIQVFITFFNS